MRDMFIGLLDKLVAVVVVLMAIAVVIGGFGAMFGPDGGIWVGLLVWIVGAVYVVMMGGMLYLFLGIYDNTKRTAAAVEVLVNKS